MALRAGLPVKAPINDTIDTRFDFRNLVVCNADGTPRGGVTSPIGSNILTATSTMVVNVQPFNAVEVRDKGVVLLSNDVVYPLTLDAAPTANSRIDVIVAKQNDSSSTVLVPDANDQATIKFIKGTAAASPSIPAVPSDCVVLGWVQIPAGVTATNAGGVVIQQTGQFTAAPGGAVPFRVLDDVGGWASPAPAPGQLAAVFGDAPNNGIYQTPDGTTWNRLNSGLVPIRPTAVSGTGVSLSGATVVLTASGLAIEIDGCFSPLFDEVLMYLEVDTAGATTGSITAQYRINGARITTPLYRWSVTDIPFSGAGSPSGTTNTTIFVVGLANGTGSTTGRTEFFGTAKAAEKRSIGTISSASGRRDLGSWAPTSFGIITGLGLTTPAALTGRIRFYGVV